MQILSASKDNILTVSRIVRMGGLIVYPTDTVYGLGCDPFNVRAVKRVFKVKDEREKPLPILASSIGHIEKIASLSPMVEKIARRFWPGPLTLIVPRKPVLPEVVTCNLNSVGVRVPNHDVALQLINLSNGLLVGTSANKTGKKTPQTAHEAARQLGEEVDAVLDGGPATLGVSSTVADLTTKNPIILREGPINFKKISDAFTQK
jgi:L-threonylcarbamoyladenylate synthase